jgi:hypothetical protein
MRILWFHSVPLAPSVPCCLAAPPAPHPRVSARSGTAVQDKHAFVQLYTACATHGCVHHTRIIHRRRICRRRRRHRRIASCAHDIVCIRINYGAPSSHRRSWRLMAAAVGAGDAGRLIQAAHTAHARVEQRRAEEDAADAAEEQRPGVVGVQPVGR